MGREDLEKWLCESIRFTGFFLTDFATLQPRGWIEAATGTQPTTRVEQSTTILEDLKTEPGVRLSMQLQPFRIDVVLGVDIQGPKIIDKIQAMGDTATRFNQFLQYIKTIAAMPLFPDFNRIALGISSLRSFPDIQTANGFAKQLLPTVQIDPLRAFDLMYRINRPKEVDIGASRRMINRLATWSVFDLMTYVTVIPPVGGTMAPSKTSVVRVDVDVNTFQDNDSLIPRDLVAIGLEILSGNAFEILLEGDIT